MTNQAAKSELMEWVSKLSDKKTLDSLLLIKQSYENGEWFDQLSPSQAESFERGVHNHKEGQVLSSEDFWSKHSQ